MTMKVLITGANGFVGSAFCAEFLRRGHQVGAFVRQGAECQLLPEGVEMLEGVFHREEDARRVFDQFQAEVVVHVASVVSVGAPDAGFSWQVNVEGTRVLAEVARKAGVKRWLQVSSMSAQEENKAVYGASKLEQEQVVKSSGIPWTIFRPSLIYGPQQRGIFYRMARALNKLPVVPVVGWGNEPMRPVHVEDLAWAFAEVAGREDCVGNTYELGGPEHWTFAEVIRAIRRELGKNEFLVPVPLPCCRMIALLGEMILPVPPLTSDNVEGVCKARELKVEEAEKDFSFAPRSFSEGFKECLSKGLLG